MSFGAALHLATFVTAGASFAAAAVGGNLHPLYTIAWSAGFLLAALTSEGRFKGGLVLGVGLLCGPALVAAVASAGLDPVLAAVYFASLLLLARLFTRKGTEGHGQVHLLSILVLAGGAAISPDLTYLLVFSGYLLALTLALLLVHLRRETGEAALALPVREVVGDGLFTGTVLLSLFALLFTATVFLVVPRATLGLGLARVARASEVGLTDRIELAGFGRLKDNDRVVLRVRSDDAGEPMSALDVYWRAQTLEIYDGLGWRAMRRTIGAEPATSLPLCEDSPDPRDEGGDVAWILDVEVVSNLGVPVLPVPDQACRVRVLSTDGRGGRVLLRRAQGREVRTVGAPVPPYEYQVEVGPNRRLVEQSRPGPEHLELPEQHPAVVLLAARLAEEAGSDPRALPEAIERWLSTRFSYSADLPRDPSLEHFLLERQAGHCEYFATAMVVLLRLRGVPARVVVGFHGGRWNQSGGYYTVRQGDAHAWVEAWREGAGWLRYEPTPEAGIGRGVGPPSLGERLADLWDSLQALWARRVLSYDRAAQRDLLRGIGRALDDLGRAFQGRSDDRRRLLPLLGWTLGSALVLLSMVLLVRHRRAWSRELGGIGPDARRSRRVYRALVRSLRGAGIERRPHHTTHDVLEAVRALVLPDRKHARGLQRQGIGVGLVTRAERVIERYDASRFGGRPMPAREARSLVKEARRIGRDIETACR